MSIEDAVAGIPALETDRHYGMACTPARLFDPESSGSEATVKITKSDLVHTCRICADRADRVSWDAYASMGTHRRRTQ